MPRTVVAPEGGGPGMSLPTVRPASPTGHVAKKLGLGYEQFSDTVVPTISIDLNNTTFASKNRSETSWNVSTEAVNPADLDNLAETDALLAGGYTVHVHFAGSLPFACFLDRMNSSGVSVERFYLRCGTYGVGHFTAYFISDEADTFRITANGAVVGTVWAGISALRHW